MVFLIGMRLRPMAGISTESLEKEMNLATSIAELAVKMFS